MRTDSIQRDELVEIDVLTAMAPETILELVKTMRRIQLRFYNHKRRTPDMMVLDVWLLQIIVECRA